MITIRARNVNDAYYQGMLLLKDEGDRCNIVKTRAGTAIVFSEPVTTLYENPCERVLFDEKRDANPFFHLFESLWMLAGRSDVAWLGKYSKRAADLIVGTSSYGHRWRVHFGYDQLELVIRELTRNMRTRRAILTMWSAEDLISANNDAKDVPCNLSCKFAINDGRLDLYVFNRSNDMIWGAYGANAVHMSMLQEYVALAVGVPVGRYWQIAVDFHAYVEEFEKRWDDNMYEVGGEFDAYAHEEVFAMPLGTLANVVDDIDNDIAQFFDNKKTVYKTAFFNDIVAPMQLAWSSYKENGPASAADTIHIDKGCPADWLVASHDWLRRRALQRELKAGAT